METNPAPTLILDLPSPELGENKFQPTISGILLWQP